MRGQSGTRDRSSDDRHDGGSAQGGGALGRRFFAIDAETLAGRLIGCRLVRVLPDGTRLSGVIVETEAYLGVQDAASHAFQGRRTARNESMYANPGTAYVYFTYGMHHCFNVVCGRKGEPAAVLVRALEPERGMDTMRRLRGPTVKRDEDLCSGPAKLCRALAIDRTLDGADLAGGGGLFILGRFGGRWETVRAARTARIGVAYAGVWASRRLRFVALGSVHVSRRVRGSGA